MLLYAADDFLLLPKYIARAQQQIYNMGEAIFFSSSDFLEAILIFAPGRPCN